MQTLTEDVDDGQQIVRGSTTAENEAALENIRFVSGVVEEVVQDYALFEVQRTEHAVPADARGIYALGDSATSC